MAQVPGTSAVEAVAAPFADVVDGAGDVLLAVNRQRLLRQYFPKGTDLSIYSEKELDRVAAELNDRPRKRLQFQKPIEAIGELLLQ